MCLLAVCTSSLWKYLFRVFAPYLLILGKTTKQKQNKACLHRKPTRNLIAVAVFMDGSHGAEKGGVEAGTRPSTVNLLHFALWNPANVLCKDMFKEQM